MSTLPPHGRAPSGSEPLDLFASAGVSAEGGAPGGSEVEAAPELETTPEAASGPDGPAGRETFAVGRLDRRTSEVQMVKPDPSDAPFPGPWSLKAVVKERGPDLRVVR